MSSVQPKRKRGRPRKDEALSKSSLLITSNSSPLKKKRGRPRKYPVEEKDHVYQENSEFWTVSVEPEVEIQEAETASEILQFEDGLQTNQVDMDKTQENTVCSMNKTSTHKTCDVCGNPFEELEVKKRKINKDKSIQLVTCETCSYYMTPHLIDTENLDNSINKYQCSDCLKSFARKDGLERHKATHSELKPFMCKLCYKSFKRSDKLTEHLRITHLEVKSAVESHLESMCEVCGSIDDVITVRITVNENESTNLNICEACNMTRSENVTTIASDESKVFQCDICLREFSRKDHVTRHRLTHLDLKPFECYICHKSFTRNDRLLRHMKSHPGAKPFSCRACGETFSTREEERSHFQAAHPRGTLKPEVCEFCQKEFRDKDKLQRHLVTHTDHKAHCCKVCGRGFKLLESLLLHQQIHSDYKPYECKFCGMTYKVRETYKRHLLVHTSDATFSCNLCSKTFKRKDKLKAHSLVHTNDINFTCTVCNSGFKRKDTFKKHCKDIHNLDPFQTNNLQLDSVKQKLKAKLEAQYNFEEGDEKLITCNLCDNTFLSQRELEEHITVHS